MHYVLLSNRNFFFELDQDSFSLYAHFIDIFINFVIIKNNFDQIIKNFRNLCLKIL